jgi:hypothetical protein
MDGAFHMREEDPEMLQALFKQGNSELPKVCPDLHATAYDSDATKAWNIGEFCLWHASASKTGSPSLITRDADELISYLNGMSLIETLQWTSRVLWPFHEERHRIEAMLDAIGKCQSLRKLQIFGQELKIK